MLHSPYSSLFTSLPDRLDFVGQEQRVAGGNRQLLELRLSDEHPVEGVAVMFRKGTSACLMPISQAHVSASGKRVTVAP